MLPSAHFSCSDGRFRLRRDSAASCSHRVRRASPDVLVLDVWERYHTCMAHVWIDDLWLKKDNGVPASAAAKRSLSASGNPLNAQVPEQWRTSRYGHGKRWRCRWYTLESGARRQHSKAFAKLADAEAFRVSMEDDVRRGKYANPNDAKRKFQDVAGMWLRSKNNVSEGVRARYECEMRVYVIPKWTDVPIGSITHDDIARWVSELSTGTYPVGLHYNRKPKPLSPRSVKSIVKVVFAGVLDYAVRVRFLMENPAREVEIPKPEYKDLVFLNIHEIEALARAAEIVGRPVDATIILFQSYVGTRINETFALQVGDIDFAKRQIRVRRTWKNGAKKQQLGPPKSGHPRTVAFPKFLTKPLRELSKGQPDTAYVFRAVRGGHINDHNWRRRIWHKAVDIAQLQDIEGLTPHSLRHSYAAIAIRAGADVKILQRQMGHTSASLTLDIYGFLFPERLTQVADAVDAERTAAIVSKRVR
ncbi:site-specific integrase [Bifidobacterium sp. MA2]|uniref:Site-specific integrase n=1 Tax=Bifidobacterium santillanense TaxID=2809028 RepID=A0ABS5URR5_9BIFI|nr:site-specific integrase [Bifidobacterium santillanense]MBT1173510.1 site-specific integrase [Bifidobacterium santillanense]